MVCAGVRCGCGGCSGLRWFGVVWGNLMVPSSQSMFCLVFLYLHKLKLDNFTPLRETLIIPFTINFFKNFWGAGWGLK